MTATSSSSSRASRKRKLDNVPAVFEGLALENAHELCGITPMKRARKNVADLPDVRPFVHRDGDSVVCNVRVPSQAHSNTEHSVTIRQSSGILQPPVCTCKGG